MKPTNRFNAVLLTMAALCLLFAYCGPTNAAEFSADMIQTAPAGSYESRVYVKGEKMRNEMNLQGMQRVSISRPDKGVVWVIMPGNMYMEMPLEHEVPRNLQSNHQELETMADKKYLGKETVNGYPCKKYLFTFHDKSQGTMTQWYSKKIDFPVKMVFAGDQGEMSMEYKNIKFEKLADNLFEVPAGHRKMQMPKIPGMQGMMPGMKQ